MPITCTDYYPENEMKCDFCECTDVRMEWRREFTLESHGWSGYHEYWKRGECPWGHFKVGGDFE